MFITRRKWRKKCSREIKHDFDSGQNKKKGDEDGHESGRAGSVAVVPQSRPLLSPDKATCHCNSIVSRSCCRGCSPHTDSE